MAQRLKPLKKFNSNDESFLPSIENKSVKFETPINSNDNYNFITGQRGSKQLTKQLSVSELQKVIDDLKKEIESRNMAVLAIQRNFDSLSTICKQEKDNNKKLASQLDAFRDDNLEISNLNSQLTQQVSKQNLIINQLENTIKSQQQEIQNRERQLDEMALYKEKIAQLEKRLDKKNIEIKEFELKVKELGIVVEKKKLEIKDQNNQIKYFNDQLEATNQKATQLEEELAQKDLQILDLNRQKKNLEQNKEKAEENFNKYEELNQKFEALNQKNRQIQNENLQLQEQINELSQQQQHSDTILHVQKKEEKAHKQEKLELLRQLGILKIYLGSQHKVQQEEKKLLQQYQKYDSFIQLYNQYLTNHNDPDIQIISRSQYFHYMQEIENYQQNIKQLISSEKKLNAQLSENENKIKDYQQKLISKDGAYTEYIKEKDKYLQIIDNLKINILSQAEEFRQYETKFYESDGINKQLKQQIDESRKQIDLLQNDLKSRDINLTQSDTKINSLKGELDKIMNQNSLIVQNLKKEYLISQSEHQQQIQEYTKKISELVNKNEELVGVQQKEKEDFKNLLEQYNKQWQEQKKLIEINKKLEFEIIEIQRISSNSEKLCNAKQSIVDSLTEKNQDLNAQINQIQILMQLVKDKNEKLEQQEQELTNQFKKEQRLAIRYKESLEEVEKKLNSIDLQNFNKRLEQISQKEKAVQNIYAKLSHAIETIIVNMSCNLCMNFVDNPVTCYPCGHTYCERCKDGYLPNCAECKGKKNIESKYKNELLNNIGSKISYLQQTIENLQQQTKQ